MISTIRCAPGSEEAKRAREVQIRNVREEVYFGSGKKGAGNRICFRTTFSLRRGSRIDKLSAELDKFDMLDKIGVLDAFSS